MYNRVRSKKSTPATFAVWIIVWIIVLFFAFAPRVSDPLAGFFGFQRGLDLLLVVSIGLLSYICFRLYIKIDSLNQNITELVRYIAIKNEIEMDDDDSE